MKELNSSINAYFIYNRNMNVLNYSFVNDMVMVLDYIIVATKIFKNQNNLQCL